MIQPNSFVSQKSPESAAVVCSTNLLGYVEQANPSTWTGSAITYEFELGEPLCNALTRSAEVFYRNANRVEATPRRREYGRVVKFDLQNSILDIQIQDNGWGGVTTRVTFTLSVSVEGYDDEMQLVNRSIVTGNGILSKRGMSAQKVVKAAVEMAVQQVADNASNLLIAGLAEPRQQRVQPARGQRPVPAAPQRWSR